MACLSQDRLRAWTARGYLTATGREVTYSARELFGALLMRELTARQFSVQASARIWIQTKHRTGNDPWWLVTNGEESRYLEDPDVVLAFLEQRRRPFFALISLSVLRARARKAAEELRAPQARKEPVVARERISFAEWREKRA